MNSNTLVIYFRMDKYIYDKHKSPIFPFLCMFRRNFLCPEFRYKIKYRQKNLSNSSYRNIDHAVMFLNFLLKVRRISIACYLSEKMYFRLRNIIPKTYCTSLWNLYSLKPTELYWKKKRLCLIFLSVGDG